MIVYCSFTLWPRSLLPRSCYPQTRNDPNLGREERNFSWTQIESEKRPLNVAKLPPSLEFESFQVAMTLRKNSRKEVSSGLREGEGVKCHPGAAVRHLSIWLVRKFASPLMNCVRSAAARINLRRSRKQPGRS